MGLPSRKRWVNTSLEFLVGFVKFVPRTLLSGYHQYRIHKIQKEQARSPMLEAVPTLESLGIVNTIPNEIGVGVYQGEILALGRVETSQASPRWVVDTLRIENLRNIQKDTLCHLLQAAGLISHYLQFCPLMQDSQNSNEIIRLQHCPYTNEPTHEKPVLLGGDNIAVCPAKELLLRLLGHNNQEYLAGQHPSTCPYSTATGLANQPKGHDTVALLNLTFSDLMVS